MMIDVSPAPMALKWICAASLTGLAKALPIEAITSIVAKVACLLNFSLVGSGGRKKRAVIEVNGSASNLFRPFQNIFQIFFRALFLG
jgi:hypothetical protein